MIRGVIVRNIVLISCLLAVVCGCQQQQSKPAAEKKLKGDRFYFFVGFEANQPLKYRLVSDRKMTVDLDPTGEFSKGAKSEAQESSEKMELIVRFEPVKADPYGVSTIKAVIESAVVSRTNPNLRSTSGDAVNKASGKSYTLKMTPAGMNQDTCEFEALVKQLGEAAFGKSPDRRIKDPDMIMDFISTQWFLWDMPSSVPDPRKGIAVGQKWNSLQIVPMPFPMRTGRNVEYKLASVEDTADGKIATVQSIYSMAEKPPQKLPIAYSGSFQMRGMFGFLQGYKPLKVEGTGVQKYNLDKGVLLSDSQKYTVDVQASMFSLGSNAGDTPQPNLKLEQTFSIELLPQ